MKYKCSFSNTETKRKNIILKKTILILNFDVYIDTTQRSKNKIDPIFPRLHITHFKTFEFTKVK